MIQLEMFPIIDKSLPLHVRNNIYLANKAYTTRTSIVLVDYHHDDVEDSVIPVVVVVSFPHSPSQVDRRSSCGGAAGEDEWKVRWGREGGEKADDENNL